MRDLPYADGDVTWEYVRGWLRLECPECSMKKMELCHSGRVKLMNPLIDVYVIICEECGHELHGEILLGRTREET